MTLRNRALILTVDGDRVSRELTSRTLLHADFDVIEAATEGDAWGIVHTRRPTLAIFNAPSPHAQAQALELCRRIRANPCTASTLIVFTSEDAHTAVRAMALESGADAFLARPFESDELVATVRALLRVTRIGANAAPAASPPVDSIDPIDGCIRQIVENAADVFWVLDVRSDELLYVSPGYRHLWGREPSRIPHGRSHWSAGIHPEDSGGVEQTYRRLAHNRRFDLEYRIVRPDGAVRWVHERGFALRDDEHRVWRLAGVASDISRLKVNDRSLRDAGRRKDQFLATLAHELRNPLAPIRSAVEIMQPQRHTCAEVLEEARSIVARQVEHLSRLVDDLLDVSRIGQGKITLRQDVIDLAATVRAALETARPAIESKRHALVCDFPDTPVFVHGDPVRVAQIVGNLLANASKYTPENGRIRIRVGTARDDAVVEITDNGIGIPSEVLPRIFDLFVQSDAARERCDGGLGIGLPLAKALAEMHGGRLDASSAGPGCGAEFVLRLPMLEATAASAAGVASAAGSPEKIAVDASLGIPCACVERRQRVLLVDDSIDAAEAMAILLQASGHEVRTAHDGVAALAAAAEFEPEAVILDLGLPRLDGCAVARELRRRPQTANAVLIAVTGYGQASDRQRTQAAGFDRHFVKPVPFTEIEAAINHVCGRGQPPPLADVRRDN